MNFDANYNLYCHLKTINETGIMYHYLPVIYRHINNNHFVFEGKLQINEWALKCRRFAVGQITDANHYFHHMGQYGWDNKIHKPEPMDIIKFTVNYNGDIPFAIGTKVKLYTRK